MGNIDLHKALAIAEILDDGTNRDKIKRTREILEMKRMLSDPKKIKEMAFYMMVNRVAPLFINEKEMDKLKRATNMKIKNVN